MLPPMPPLLKLVLQALLLSSLWLTNERRKGQVSGSERFQLCDRRKWMAASACDLLQ